MPDERAPQQDDPAEGSRERVEQELSRTKEKRESEGKPSKGCPSKTSGSVRKDLLE
jgi:hypothetical protein